MIILERFTLEKIKIMEKLENTLLCLLKYKINQNYGLNVVNAEKREKILHLPVMTIKKL